jgi:mono/diheme cytochrome c family protein
MIFRRDSEAAGLPLRKDVTLNMRKTVAIVSVCGFILSVSYAALGAQGTTSAGVYTAEQATRGEAVYKEQCAACHGDNLEGSGPMPPLAGQDFLMNWQGKTLGDLFEKTQTTMPATAPGTMMPAQVADVLAFMLKSSKFPEGTTPLEGKMEALVPISIDAPL